MTRKLTLYFLLITISGMAQTNTKTKDYKVDEFNEIITRGGGNLEIYYSDQYSFQANTHDSCGELIEVSVSSKTLYIEIKDSKANGCDITIRIGVPSLDELVQNRGGNIVLMEGFIPKKSFQCKIIGGGNIDVSKLSVDSFYASIEGGGTILLNAEKELEGNISGGGLIEYSGNPKVKSNVSEGGAIRKK